MIKTENSIYKLMRCGLATLPAGGQAQSISNEMDSIDKLANFFNKFPGIGPRQAKRFVYFLISENEYYVKELLDQIMKVRREVTHCKNCFKLSNRIRGELCEICEDSSRDESILMLVAKDIDLENISRSGQYNGLYFVIGGLIPILEKNPENKIRQKGLLAQIQKLLEINKLKEIVIALSANSEGDNTSDYLRSVLEPIVSKRGVKISILGRGLSTGTELEYSDSDTIKNALLNRR